MEVPEPFISYVLSKGAVTVADTVEDTGLKEVTVRSYLSRMRSGGMVERVGRGTYQVLEGDRVPQVIPEGLRVVLDLIGGTYPDLRPVAWAASMMSEYMHNLPGGDVYSIDVPRHTADQLRGFLSERGFLVFMDPGPVPMEDYSWSKLEPVFMFRRGEEFASIQVNGHRVAMLDRIWVDLYYLRTRRGLPFPLVELGVILRNMIASGVASTDRMLKYSSRRGLRAEVSFILYELAKADPDLHLIGSLLPYGRRAEDWIQEIVVGSVEGW